MTKKECKEYDFGDKAEFIDYEKIYYSRFKVLKKAFERFEKDEAYDNFIKENAYWLDDYSLYMAIKDSKGGISWNEWEDALKNREETALENAREELAEEIDFYKFQQYEFDKQWSQLHTYANEQGIQIVGDIPIYVAFDGADTWASPKLFQFDEENNPVAVAGCLRMIFLQQASCGAIRCIIGNIIKRQDMAGGLRESVIVSNYMM